MDLSAQNKWFLKEVRKCLIPHDAAEFFTNTRYWENVCEDWLKWGSVIHYSFCSRKQFVFMLTRLLRSLEDTQHRSRLRVLCRHPEDTFRAKPPLSPHTANTQRSAKMTPSSLLQLLQLQLPWQHGPGCCALCAFITFHIPALRYYIDISIYMYDVVFPAVCTSWSLEQMHVFILRFLQVPRCLLLTGLQTLLFPPDRIRGVGKYWQSTWS